MTDYEADARPFAECMKDFAAKLNGGKTYGARPIAAAALRIPEKTLQNWMDGRTCPHEASFRHHMTLIETHGDILPG